MSVSGRIRAYQVVSRCPRYALIRPDTVPIHADTKSAPLSSVSDCKIQRDDSKKRDRVRIGDVHPRPYQVLYQRLCIFLYLWCVSCCIALRITHCILAVVSLSYRSTYRGCIRKTYHRTRIARVSHYVSHAYQCLYLQRRDICVAACISDSIRVYRQCIGYMYRDVS